MHKLAISLAALAALSACETPDGQRATAGALTGATAALILDGNVATATAAGAAAGALCDDVGLCP
ncbi:hypothetical protein [Pseudaestuariivita atlantica]|uniref:Lipoprotein n=1 Tax=Pseudaestuariivita atlantica TaxID=1317121 RepID=A0A0L1JLA2_9RHOB|nr:hypothetical protein [Pseudaestuariivita atlantica]KNG92529.1 hypothetical protein ATO11_15970 [Pseudaestuariivita atlantica]